MKNNSIYISLFSCFIMLSSCSVMHHSFMYYVEKNYQETSKKMDEIYEKNGNAFCLNSSYSNFSVVWSYHADSIEIYKLLEGNVSERQTYKDEDHYKIKEFNVEEFDKLNNTNLNCPMELDGDIFALKLLVSKEMCERNYALDIECLKNEIYKSEFMEKIVFDINKYELWK